MSKRNFITALAARTIAAVPALAANPDAQDSTQSGTPSSGHVSPHMGTSRRATGARGGASSSDDTADLLNSRELSSIQQGQGGMSSPGGMSSGPGGTGSTAPARE
jgi:hypothetical protein